jgi:hypothetical protein
MAVRRVQDGILETTQWRVYMSAQSGGMTAAFKAGW